MLGTAELGVEAGAGEEFVVGAALEDAAFLQDEDEVGVADGGEAVRDDEGGAAGEEALERLLDEELGVRVDAGGGFIEDEDGRIFQESAGDGDALFFADR